MNIFTITTVTVLLLAIEAAYIQSIPAPPLHVQACGSVLADILKKTCSLGYNTYNSGDVDESSSNSRRRKRQIRKRSIIQECCHNSCSYLHILDYCYGGSSVNITWTESAVGDTEPTKTKNCKDKTRSLGNNEIVIGDRQNEICDDRSTGVKTSTAKVRIFHNPLGSTPMPNDVITKINLSDGESNQSKKLPPYYTKPPFINALTSRFRFGAPSKASVAPANPYHSRLMSQ